MLNSYVKEPLRIGARISQITSLVTKEIFYNLILSNKEKSLFFSTVVRNLNKGIETNRIHSFFTRTRDV